MIKRSVVRKAREWAFETFRKAGVPIRDDERDKIEIADFGLGRFDEQGMHLFTMVATERYAAKALALAPLQTEPEHWHPPVGDDPGKQETVRLLWGTLYFYLPGKDTLKKGFVPRGRDAIFTCRHELVMKPGDQLTLKPGQKHWFQAAGEGAVLYTFSSTARDVLDGFSDPDVQRVTQIVDD
jgi:D-lyxose ketol-isomerase